MFFWDSARQGGFVMALCRDRSGRIWAGTEGNGLWVWDPERSGAEYRAWQDKHPEIPKNPRSRPLFGWSQFTTSNTGPKRDGGGLVLTSGTLQERALGDDCIYALACDRLGRVWAGHRNGVSVYDGRPVPAAAPKDGYPGWRNYDVLSGPAGERVFSIATNPADGDVWLATDAGLSRYRLASGSWSYYTRSDGLPSDQVSCLAFAPDGTVFAGTQCDGLGMATPVRTQRPAKGKPAAAGDEKAEAPAEFTLEYPEWRHATTPGNTLQEPGLPQGKGFPSPLVNALQVSKSGMVFAATSAGLAWSADKGDTWAFIRGRDWLAKYQGQIPSPAEASIAQGREREKELKRPLLLEDHCTSLAEDMAGNLWIGHWRCGIEALDGSTGTRLLPPADSFSTLIVATPAGAYLRSILPAYPGIQLTACYGEGMEAESAPNPGRKPWMAADSARLAVAGDTVPLPSAAPVPSKDRFTAVVSSLQQRPAQSRPGPWGVYMGDDWTTQGDWTGRFGRKHAVLWACNSPGDHEFSHGLPGLYDIECSVGRKPNPREVVRHWCWEESSPDRRVPYSPAIGFRRPAGIDDHGESYGPEVDGPDLWLDFTVPAGQSKATLYFTNYDGHDGNNRIRDYVLQLYAAGPVQGPELARARVSDWFGGVHKSFVVSGPGRYRIRVARNHSFNVMVTAAFLDRFSGPFDPTESPVMSATLPMFGGVRYGPPAPPSSSPWKWAGSGDFWAALAVSDPGRTALFIRYARDAGAPDDILSLLRWRSLLWTSADRWEFDDTVGRGWSSLQEQCPQLKSKTWRRRSPGTL